MRDLRILLPGRSGTAALEFALVAVPFLIVMLSVIDLGRYFATKFSLQTLASETARAMLIKCTSNTGAFALPCADPLTDAQRQHIAPLLYLGGQTPIITFPLSVAGTLVVRATLPIDYLVPLVWGSLPSPDQSATLRY
jgi:hypothetical protein